MPSTVPDDVVHTVNMKNIHRDTWVHLVTGLGRGVPPKVVVISARTEVREAFGAEREEVVGGVFGR
ncbi:hypothetical protein ACIOD2_07960 [Amycolatopsis sp. NPDC088138]|uniref:hypothetical protein n=1 Tax=Amycolatopsis sp. NPDC088138 TaxID=3363938 RepID=UPI0038053DDD